MPTPQFTVLASLVKGTATPTLSDGANSEGVTEALTGGNGPFKSGDNLYCVISDQAGNLQVFQSSDLIGSAWATFGAAAAQTKHGGAQAVVLSGGKLYVGYCGGVQTNDVYLRVFDLNAQTWSAETHGAVNTSGINFWQGPYQIFVRPDGSVVMIGNNTAGEVHFVAVNFDNTNAYVNAVDFPSGGINLPFVTAIMDTDGTIHVFGYVTTGGFPDPYHQVYHTDNSVGAVQHMTGFAQLIDWNVNAPENGLLDSGTFYLAAGIKTVDYPVIWGRPVILYGTDGAWTLTPELDTNLDPDFSMYDAHLFLSGGYLGYVARLINSAGNGYIIRGGFALLTEFTDPTKWTWETVYDLRVPNPAVSIFTPGAYSILAFKGPNTGMVLGDDSIARYATTLTHSQFITLLFSLSFPVVSPAAVTFTPLNMQQAPVYPIQYRPADSAGKLVAKWCDPLCAKRES